MKLYVISLALKMTFFEWLIAHPLQNSALEERVGTLATYWAGVYFSSSQRTVLRSYLMLDVRGK